MQDESFDALTEDVQVITVDTASRHTAERMIVSCEYCDPGDAEIPFDWILAEVTGKRGPVEFVLSEPGRCPNCKQPVLEKTLIEPKD
jgi:hypothetical protein